MVSAPREIVNICRFCLCDDENKLRPIEEMLPLPIKDVERFTGIKINSMESVSYAICFNCTQKLESAANFRQFCLENNAHFQELLGVIISSTKSGVRSETVQSLTHEESDPLELHFVIQDDEDDVERAEETVVEICKDDDDGGVDNDGFNESNRQHQKPWNAQVEEYSANYIELGAYSDSDEYDQCSVSDQCSIADHTYSSFAKKRIKEHSEDCTQATIANNPDEASPVREIITHRTRKSYNPQQLCNLCGKLVTNIYVHIDTHSDERKYACPHCPVRMNNSGNMNRHIHGVHLKRICSTCSICGKGFTVRNSYVSHMLSRHGIGDRYKCTVCSKMFTYRSSLYSHKRKAHSHARNSACGICGKTFKINGALKLHMRVHSTERPYACGKCPKRFKSSYAMKIHELTHSGIVFQCTLCGKTYRYKSLLNMHLRKMHSDEEGGVPSAEGISMSN